jgi:hypothetical protein
MGSFVNGVYIPANGETGWGTNVANNQRRLADIHVNVKAKGALGDGSTDDTAAIQSAIDEVTTAGGGTVFFPPTSSYYKVVEQSGKTRALKIAASGVRLLGMGYGSRIHNASADSSCVLVGDDHSGDTATYTGVTIENLRFTQTLPHTVDGAGAVYIRSVYGARVLNCDFDSVAEAIHVVRRNTADARPEACIVAGNRVNSGSNARMGIEIYAAKGCQILGNTITSSNTTGLGIRAAGGLDNLFANNFIRGTNSGFSLQSSTGPADVNVRAAVINNRVVGVLGTSATAIIAFGGIDDALIQGNYLDGFVYGVWLKSDAAGGTDRATVRGNRLRTSASTTHAIFADPPATGNNTDVRVEGNHIDALAGGNGIYLDTVDGRSYILDNTIIVASGGNAIGAPNTPSGSEVYALGNEITGVDVLLANDLAGSGAGKFVHWDHSGNTANTLVQTNGNDLIESIFSPAQITANQNDYDPLFGSGRQSSIWRINSDAARNITGIAGGWSGRRLTLINTGGFIITLTNDDALSAAGNRIYTGTGAGVGIPATGAAGVFGKAHLIYDDTTARWRVV